MYDGIAIMQATASSHISQCKLAPHGAFVTLHHQLMAAYERLEQADVAGQDVVDLEPFEIEEVTDMGDRSESKSKPPNRGITRVVVAAFIAFNVLVGTVALLMLLFRVRSRESWNELRVTWVFSNCIALGFLFVIAVIVGSYRLARRFI